MSKDVPQRRPRPLGGSSPGLARPAGPGSGVGPAKPKRNPIEAAVVWGTIGVLCVVALIELAAKLSYDRALSGLTKARANHTRNDPFTKDVALRIVSRRPIESTTVVDGVERKAYLWTWFSLFKTYRIELFVTSKDNYVIDFRTGVLTSDHSEE